MRKFDEIYHLASQSDVAYSFSYPDETYDININGTLNLLNAVRDYSPNSRVYFAGSSEMFGQPKHTPQNEEYPMRPRSPYGVSKLSGYWSSKVYREAYGLFIACGILYNHESEIRGPNFVTRKISIGIAQYLKTGQPFSLGNIQARKDWGYAPDYVKGMWMMMQRDEPDDFVMGTGEMHTVREFLEESLKVADIDFKFKDRGDFVGYYDNVRGKWFVTVSKELYRPSEADNYLADITKARNILGWEPTTDFRTLVEKMVVNDISNIE